MSLAVKSISGGNKLEAKLEELAAKAKDARVRVGILEGATYPDGTSTALVGFVQEFGTDDGRIPPRSFMRSTVMQRENAWRQGLKKLLQQGHSGKAALNMLGMQMAGDIKTQISAITSPPLKPQTAARKGHEKPLIDKKQLINAINYETVTGSTE